MCSAWPIAQLPVEILFGWRAHNVVITCRTQFTHFTDNLDRERVRTRLNHVRARHRCILKARGICFCRNTLTTSTTGVCVAADYFSSTAFALVQLPTHKRTHLAKVASCWWPAKQGELARSSQSSWPIACWRRPPTIDCATTRRAPSDLRGRASSRNVEIFASDRPTETRLRLFAAKMRFHC